MVNQELFDYVKKETSAGVSRETITTALLSQGWQGLAVNEVFQAVEKGTPFIVENGIWTRSIPRMNWFFMVISLLLVFGLDLVIIFSNPELFSFWSFMLAVLAAFAVFFGLENYVFSKKFATTKSTLDGFIVFIIVVRNLIFILNFIPVVQLAGIVAIFYAGWMIVPLYVILLLARYYSLSKAVTSPQVQNFPHQAA